MSIVGDLMCETESRRSQSACSLPTTPLLQTPFRYRSISHQLHQQAVKQMKMTLAEEHEITYKYHCQLKPILFIIRLCGMYPSPLCPSSVSEQEPRRWHKLLRCLQTTFWWLFNAALLAALTHLMVFTVQFCPDYNSGESYLNVLTVCCLISACKPLIAIVCVICFSVGVRRHKKMIHSLAAGGYAMKNRFGINKTLRPFKVEFFVTIVIIVLTLHGIGISEWGLINGFRCATMRPGSLNETICGYPKDFGMILSPMISLIGVMPCAYFVFVMHILEFFTDCLTDYMHMQADQFTIQFRQSYRYFVALTKMQRTVSKFFGPWIMFSIAWSLLATIFAVFFLTQKNLDIYRLSPGLQEILLNDPIQNQQMTREINFNIGWTGLQLLVALIHLLVISLASIRINEKSRRLAMLMLRCYRSRPTDPDSQTTFKLVRKISLQSFWGINGWRVLEFERSFYIQMVSGVMTYTLFLYRMGSPHPSE